MRAYYFYTIILGISPISSFATEGVISGSYFLYGIVFLNLALTAFCFFLMKNHQVRTEPSASKANEGRQIAAASISHGVDKLKELFSCDFEKAKGLFFKIIEEDKNLGSYLVSKLPLAILLELKKSFNNTHQELFSSCLNTNSEYLKKDINPVFEDRLLEITYKYCLEDGNSNKFEIIRAERWAALIKKDSELGKYLFLFSEMGFVAKVFSFLDKEDINLVMDLVFQEKGDLQGIHEKVDEFIKKAKSEEETKEDFQKMLSYFSKYDDKNLGLGIEKVSIYHKNEVKVFEVLIKNISPTLLGLVSPELFKKLKSHLKDGEFFKYLVSLPQEKRSHLFDLFLKPSTTDVDEYKRFLATSTNEILSDDEQVLFKRKFYDILVENSELYSELFNHWKLPLKRLSTGMSFESSFKDYYSIKKSA